MYVFGESVASVLIEPLVKVEPATTDETTRSHLEVAAFQPAMLKLFTFAVDKPVISLAAFQVKVIVACGVPLMSQYSLFETENKFVFLLAVGNGPPVGDVGKFPPPAIANLEVTPMFGSTP